MKIETANMMRNTAKRIGTIIFSLIGILGSVKLKTTGVISEPTLVVFVLSSVFVGLFIVYSHRIEFLNLLKLEFKMRQVEEARQDVIKREENIKKIAILICEITAFESAIRGLSVSREANKIRKRWFKSKSLQLLDTVGVKHSEKEKTLKVIKLFSSIFQGKRYDKEKVSAGWEKFWAYIESDIKDTSENN